jgi:hypothetical protein
VTINFDVNHDEFEAHSSDMNHKTQLEGRIIGRRVTMQHVRNFKKIDLFAKKI